MLLTVVSVALVIVPCDSQSIIQGPAWGISSPEKCSRANAPYLPDLRKDLFTELNKIRRKVANGVKLYRNDTYPKEKKLMYAMVYKCELEDVAFDLLKRNETSHQSYVVLNYTSGTPGGNYYPTSQVMSAVNKWKIDEGAQSMLLYPVVPYFGCGYSYDNNLLRVVCVFFKDTRYRRDSAPCEDNSDCSEAVPSDHYKSSECGGSLCWKPL